MSAIGFAEIPELGDASTAAEADRHCMECFDVVVVGARCAGAVTAMLLARAGLRVLVIDRQHSGAGTISGLMIKPDGGGPIVVLGDTWRRPRLRVLNLALECAPPAL
jgi:glycine/D-amino acid oxidase-like deaminating enzyme